MAMNQKPSLRRKWEIAAAGFCIAATAVGGCWINGMLGNFPPFPEDFRNNEILRRITEANNLQEAAIPKGRTSYPGYEWKPQSLELLRNKLGWEPGKISLFPVGSMNGEASPQLGQLLLFFINDTEDDLEIPSQGGDIYLKLEVSLSDGQWQRAQTHAYSWCGVSYSSRTLPAHSYVKMQGYQPTAGRLAKVRYAIHNGAVEKFTSAEFEGVYSPDDLAMSEYDAMGLREADLPRLRAFLLRKVSPSLLSGSIRRLRQTAWNSILNGTHDRKAALATAKEVLRFDPTLETRSASLETLIGEWQAAMDAESKRQPRTYGFIITNKVAQGDYSNLKPSR